MAASSEKSSALRWSGGVVGALLALLKGDQPTTYMVAAVFTKDALLGLHAATT
jgi:hypothetical protein